MRFAINALRACPLLAMAVLAGSLSSQTFSRGVYEDERHGFKIELSSEWEVMPIPIDERWVVAQFLSKKEYVSKSTSRDDLRKHRPMVRVIEFTDDKRKEKGIPILDPEDGSVVGTDLPYRDYRDYLQRQRSGFYIENEELHSEHGLASTRYQIRVEHSGEASMRIVTWVFRGATDEFAVEFEVLADRYSKLASGIRRSLVSFRRVPRAGVSTAKSRETRHIDPEEWRKRPARERERFRREIERRRTLAVVETLPDGWRVMQSKHYVVISHTDAKFTKKIVQAAEACRKWLDRQFGGMSDDYVMRGVIRVCKDSQERDAYSTRSGNWDSFNQHDREVVVRQKKNSGTAGNVSWWSGRNVYGELFAGLFDNYLYDKDFDALDALPSSFHVGVRAVLMQAKMKNGRLDLSQSTVEKVRIAEAGRAGELRSVRELMTLEHEDLYENDDPYENKGLYEDEQLDGAKLFQLAQLVRFVAGPGAKKKHLKGFLARYARSSRDAFVRWNARHPISDALVDQREEESNARARSRRSRDRASFILEEVNLAVCDWSDREWKSLERSWQKFVR